MKKCYVSPSITTETFEIGVFGCYGHNGISQGPGGKNQRNRHRKRHGGVFGFFNW